MGLDMYLYKVNRSNKTTEELQEIDDDASPDNPLCEGFELEEYEYLRGNYTIFHREAYWRKFNALHGWFVDNAQDGKDDCGYYKVDKTLLNELYNVLVDVQNTKNPEKLQPVGGFFFGSTKVDEWYWGDVENSIEQIGDIIQNFDWEKYDLYYHSSW